MNRIRVAIVQAEVPPLLEPALERTAELARRAAAGGARLIVFPETWIPGYPVWLDVCRDAGLFDHPPVRAVYRRMAENSVVVGGASGERLREIAREVEATLVVGVSERVVEGPGRGTLMNAMLTIGPDGALLNHHRKLVPAYTERLVFGGGDADGLRAVDTPAGRVGGLVCWEHWMPLARQALHDSGEEIHVAGWSACHELHQVASRGYAFEGRCFVLVAGGLLRPEGLPPELEPHPDRLPGADGWLLRGGSAVIGPDGRYLVEPVFDREEILEAELDLGEVTEQKMNLDVAGHFSRPDLLRLEVRRGSRGG
jgi:nitrilase